MLILATRFMLELLGVAAVAWLGATAPVDGAAAVGLAIGAPVLLIVLWGRVAAPKARNPLPLPARELIGTTILLGIAGALAVAGHVVPAVAYATLVVADQVLLLVLRPDVPAAHHAGRAA